MFLKSFHAKNYRTLENIDIHFHNFYTALSGKNNSGKSNVMRGVQNILSSGFYFRMLTDEVIGYGEFNYSKDFTNWNTTGKDKEPIVLKVVLELDKITDTSIYNFIRDLVLKEPTPKKSTAEKELLTIEYTKNPDDSSTHSIKFGEFEIDKDLPKRETLRRIKSSETIIFHNSTENGGFAPFRVGRETIKNFINDQDRKEISKRVDAVVKKVQKSLKIQQEELASFLGRLEDKYEVSLSIEGLKLEKEAIEISLKEKGFDVTLDDWGSGTRNRTLIFLSLLNAKRCQNTQDESERLNPILLVEEPESFLHPSAQAEFGRTLQDLANELKIQVIVSTHSPYLLSHKQPDANILIDRNLKPYARNKSSKIVQTDDSNWYRPFAESLGINSDDFGPLKDTIFNETNEVIFVEGEIDKEYFELLRNDGHGKNKLNFAGEIYPYGGADVLMNNSLIKFIKNRYNKFIVTVDLDKYDSVKKSLEIVGIQEGVNLVTIGLNQNGKRNIEGLLPENILKKVYAENTDLVQAAMENSKAKKTAQKELKKKYLEAFESDSSFSEVYYAEFYKVSRRINKMLTQLSSS